MKLFIAVAGSTKQECLANLKLALENSYEFRESNAFTGDTEEYQIDYQFSEAGGYAMLADLIDYPLAD